VVSFFSKCSNFFVTKSDKAKQKLARNRYILPDPISTPEFKLNTIANNIDKKLINDATHNRTVIFSCKTIYDKNKINIGVQKLITVATITPVTASPLIQNIVAKKKIKLRKK